MKKMTEYQRKLVEESMDIVHQVIRSKINISGRVLLNYDDFFQVGCEGLCKAAMSYDPSRGEFGPMARRCVYNALVDHCRAQNRVNYNRADENLEADNEQFSLKYMSCRAGMEEGLIYGELSEAFTCAVSSLNGVAKRGAEVIQLKSLGYTTTEIAQQYGTNVNNVNAWISKARKKLAEDPQFLMAAGFPCC